MTQINICTSPADFFREKISSAKVYIDQDIHSNIENYLVKLLVDFISLRKITGTSSENDQDLSQHALGVYLVESMQLPEKKMYANLKRLADVSLYISGFFQEYFNRKAFDVDYYMTLGASAYGHIAQLSNSIDEDSSQIYEQMAQQFRTCVDLVACVSDIPGKNQNSDIVSVYHRWTRTNSRRLHKILLESGITPISSHIKSAS